MCVISVTTHLTSLSSKLVCHSFFCCDKKAHVPLFYHLPDSTQGLSLQNVDAYVDPAGLKSQMKRRSGRSKTGAAGIAGVLAVIQKATSGHQAAVVPNWGGRVELQGRILMGISSQVCMQQHKRNTSVTSH